MNVISTKCKCATCKAKFYCEEYKLVGQLEKLAVNILKDGKEGELLMEIIGCECI